MDYINNPFAYTRIERLVNWLWAKLLCPHGLHLFDEVLTDTPQAFFVCDGCGFILPSPYSLMQAVDEIIKEPYGCSFCDSGVLRNPAKGHDPECGFENARVLVAEIASQ